MTALALNPTDDLAEMLGRLPQIERYINECTNAEDVQSAVDQARLLRELKRIRGLSEQVAAMALRIEVLALRRLAELGATFSKAGDKRCAERLARTAMPVLDLLLSSESCPRTARGVGDRLAFMQRKESARSDAENGWIEPAVSATERQTPQWELADAAAKILNAATSTGEEFTVSDAADRLLEEIGAQHSDLHAMAARDLIREAIAADDGDSDGFEHMPAVVTFRKFTEDGTGPWVRIPWRNASVAQLRWMAQFRMSQAEAMLASARRLATLVDEIASTMTGDDDESESLLAEVCMPATKAA